MGSNTPKHNKNAETTADQNLADGLGKHAATIMSIMVGGASVATTDIVTALQARIATAKVATSARAIWQAAVQADRDERAKTKTLVSVTKQTLLGSFAGQVDTLADFGLTPRKARVVSPEALVAAAAKAKATRAARHTMGKKQKKAVETMVVSAVA
jgi:sulfite reductase beta subunit-like hemoprotein